MYQEFFLGRGLLLLPIVAMLSFLVTFVAAVVFVLRGSHRDTYETLARLPLGDDASPAPAMAQAHARNPS